MAGHNGYRTARTKMRCWQGGEVGLADHYIEPGERYLEHNDHGTIMRLCPRCLAEQDAEHARQITGTVDAT